MLTCAKAMASVKFVTLAAANVEIRSAGTAMQVIHTRSNVISTNRNLAPPLSAPNHETVFWNPRSTS